MEQMMEYMVAILEVGARLDSLVSRVNAHQVKKGRLKGCQPRTDDGLSRSDTGQEQTKAEIKTGLEEMKATE
jgi:hypothetical protein